MYALAYYTQHSIWYVMGACVVLIAFFMCMRRMTLRLEEPIQYKAYTWISFISLVVLLGYSVLTWYADSRIVALRAEFNDSDRSLLHKDPQTLGVGEKSQLFDILFLKPVTPAALGDQEPRFRELMRLHYASEGIGDANAADMFTKIRLEKNPGEHQ